MGIPHARVLITKNLSVYRLTEFNLMTVSEINKKRKNGIFSVGNSVSGWFAISRDGIHLIEYYKGKWTFSQKEDIMKFYTEKGFAKKVGILLNGGF